MNPTPASEALRVSLEADHLTVTDPKDAFLKIDFQRTVRIPDTNNGKASNLPAGLGKFPLYKVEDFAALPNHMIAKGGFFFPMYHREAMWINLSSDPPFALKIYTGGVNAASGESMVETETTMLRRKHLLAQNKSIQDYLVTPDQLWLDGIANADGVVRQFVAVRAGSGYSVEAQVTGHDYAGGLRFEITPAKRNLTPVTIYVKTLTGKTMMFRIRLGRRIADLKQMVQDREGIPTDQQRFVWDGKQIEDNKCLDHYGIENASTIHLVLRLRGGGWIALTAEPEEQREMALGAGGLIKQVIKKDKSEADKWDRERTMFFNVQILNSKAFQAVTGRPAPPSPVTVKTYSHHGLPYFDIYGEHPTSIHGWFADIRSVNQLDKSAPTSRENRDAIAEVDNNVAGPVILLDPYGNRHGFRHVSELEKQVAAFTI